MILLSPKTKRFVLFINLAIIVYAFPVYADIFKCVSDDGVTTFSDEPCGENGVVALETMDYRFDDVIGNASPYPDQPIAPSMIDEDDFITHAKKIGKCILPHEYNHTCLKRPNIDGLGVWVILHFGTEKSEKVFEIEMVYYTRNSSNLGAFVWLNYITIKKNGKLYDPPTMNDVSKFIKTGTGLWKNPTRLKINPY